MGQESYLTLKRHNCAKFCRVLVAKVQQAPELSGRGQGLRRMVGRHLSNGQEKGHVPRGRRETSKIDSCGQGP